MDSVAYIHPPILVFGFLRVYDTTLLSDFRLPLSVRSKVDLLGGFALISELPSLRPNLVSKIEKSLIESKALRASLSIFFFCLVSGEARLS